MKSNFRNDRLNQVGSLSSLATPPPGLSADVKKAFLHINMSELSAACHVYWEVLETSPWGPWGPWGPRPLA